MELEFLSNGARGVLSLSILGEQFEFHENESLKVDFNEKIIEFDPSDVNHRKRFERILKRKLIDELEPAVAYYSTRIGVKFNRITIKKQRSRWGSCSSNGNLNFNILLVCLPRELIRYVACHEVAHLKESNHSKAFKNLIKSEFGSYREMEKKLSEQWRIIQDSRPDFLVNFAK